METVLSPLSDKLATLRAGIEFCGVAAPQGADPEAGLIEEVDGMEQLPSVSAEARHALRSVEGGFMWTCGQQAGDQRKQGDFKCQRKGHGPFTFAFSPTHPPGGAAVLIVVAIQ